MANIPIDAGFDQVGGAFKLVKGITVTSLFLFPLLFETSHH
jgi:hypothetical protein